MDLTKAKDMAHELMRHHGVRDYTFSFMQERARFSRSGECNWVKKTIRLQPNFTRLNHPFVVKQTLLHEIAHALKPKHYHNKFWKQQARAIGYVGQRCWSKKIVKTD
jgi:predicted SprT family Zn-dependent metalloprotease